MESNKEIILIELTRTGGIMAQKLVYKNGISMSMKEWKALKEIKNTAPEKPITHPDGFIYKFSSPEETLVLHEQQLPDKWKRKLDKYYE